MLFETLLMAKNRDKFYFSPKSQLTLTHFIVLRDRPFDFLGGGGCFFSSGRAFFPTESKDFFPNVKPGYFFDDAKARFFF